MNIAELLLIPASMFPNQEILRFDGQGVSYEQLQDRVGRTASVLAQLGVEQGDRVAVLQTNTPGVVEILFAAASLGAVCVPLNYRARHEELEHLLSVATPKLLVVGERYLDLALGLSGVSAGRVSVVTIGHDSTDLPRLDTLIESADLLLPEDVPDEDPAVMMFTSGTSADAKGVLLTHMGLVDFVFGTTEPADGEARGKVLLAAPIYHVAGLSAVLTATFAGRTIVLMRQFEAEEWLQLAAAEQATHAFLVPTMLKRVLDHPRFTLTDLSSLQVLSYGAAPMPLSVVRRAIEAFPPEVQFINAFGQTETTSTVTMLSPDDHRLEGTPEEVEKKLQRLSSIGRPLPGVEIAIMDDLGDQLPPNQIGEIAVRSERVMSGYSGDDATTRATIRDGWLHTHDLGWQDEDGYIFLAGRQSDMIIRGGENVAPAEIEAVLVTHQAVEEAAVIGLPDEEWGERIAAVVILRAGTTISADELIEYVHNRLASFKRPEQIFFTDTLPRSALGKLLRRELRAQYEPGRV